MDLADIIYLLGLISLIFFGRYYQKIEDKETKKWVGSVVGFVLMIIVSGLHVWHALLTFIVNAVIILYLDKRKCHVVSFTFTFLYLIALRSAIIFKYISPPTHVNLIQMVLTLKLVGLAFEVNASNRLLHDKSQGDKSDDQILDDKKSLIEVSFVDILHYTFNYIGVLTGPYFKYRTFNDYFEYPFNKHVDWKKHTLQKLKIVPIAAVSFLIASHYFPLSYAKTDEFYNERSFWYRLWFIWPEFFIFRTRLYVGLILSECVCTVAGFGAYPVFTEPKCGRGPSVNFKELDAASKDTKKMQSIEYNYETIHIVNPVEAEFCPSARDTMKHWNMCIQYWLAVNIYKQFPSKKFRTLATMFVSALWHGLDAGYFVCLLGTAFVFPVDTVVYKLVMKNRVGLQAKVAHVFMVVFKMFYFSYLSTAFNLLSLGWIIKYYNSIYHAGIVLGLILYFGGNQLLKMQRGISKTEKEKVSSKVE